MLEKAAPMDTMKCQLSNSNIHNSCLGFFFEPLSVDGAKNEDQVVQTWCCSLQVSEYRRL